MNKNKDQKKREKSNKEKLLIVSGISLFTILGGTLAYFTTSDTYINNFKIAKYQAKIVEEFTSPSNWTPGTTTNKTIKVTNNGTISMAVRASYTENWTSANGKSLSLKDSKNNVASIINFSSDWVKDADGYYYYGSKNNKTELRAGQTSSSFITGVKFNENIESSLNKSVSSDGKTITYTSTGDGYDGAQYTLTVKLETIQYDQANNFWQ